MDKQLKDMLIGLVIGIIITIMFAVLADRLKHWPQSYKQGQIDVLTNNVKYELVTKPDSTRTWEKINERTK